MAMSEMTERNVIGNGPEINSPQSSDSQSTNPPLDHFLQSLVGLANHGVEMGITLTVGGFLISGFLASGKRYFDDLAEAAINVDLSEETREQLRKYYLNFGSAYEMSPETDAEAPSPVYLHLRDAKYFHHSGKSIPGNASVWWRGRISEVNGFSLGVLGE